MALTTPAFSAAEAAALAKDKPFYTGSNRFASSHTTAWKTGSTATWAAGSDVTESGYPGTRMCDDLSNLRGRPNTSNANFCLLFDFGAAGIDFDVVALLNHNLPAAATVSGVVSDANTFSPNQSIGVATVTAGRRVVIPQATRFVGVRYLRLLLQLGSSMKPEIGEVFIGGRVQLNWRPDVPYDDQELASQGVLKTTTPGGITRVVNLGPKGQRRLRAQNLLNAAAVQANVLASWKEHGGARPFLWVDNPLTAPYRAAWVHQDDPSIYRPGIDAMKRQWNLEAHEQGPHYVALEP